MLKLKKPFNRILNVETWTWREISISPKKRTPRNAKNKRGKEDYAVAVGKEYDVEISQLSPNGEGIARVKGFIIFVRKAKLGDHVKVKIIDVNSVSADAEVVSNIQSWENLNQIG